ncbi:MAG: dihydroorotase [Spirochaetia bacterium]|nr:dihydroorotase [Spirochaetia bacterium]
MDQITIRMPDDFHLHVRDGAMLEGVIHHTVARFARAIIMPNLKPPVVTVSDAALYRERIQKVAGNAFEPLMTLYLTDQTNPQTIEAAKKSGFIHGVKLYPSGATTNSDAGVRELAGMDSVFRAMEEVDLPLLIHAEVTDPSIDIFARETVFLDRFLRKLPEKFPRLRIVFEHITTAAGAEFVTGAPPTVAATITPHHLLLNRNALFVGGIRPHNYCLPVLKKETDRLALMEAATSGNPRFFAGTDSAPHEKSTKENACGCAGIYNAHAAVELYAEAFDSMGALDKLEGFMSESGARFYGLPLNNRKLKLIRKNQIIPAAYNFAGLSVVPMRSGETISWSIEDAFE